MGTKLSSLDRSKTVQKETAALRIKLQSRLKEMKRHVELAKDAETRQRAAALLELFTLGYASYMLADILAEFYSLRSIRFEKKRKDREDELLAQDAIKVLARLEATRMLVEFPVGRREASHEELASVNSLLVEAAVVLDQFNNCLLKQAESLADLSASA